jgi:hypothetical protein
MRFLASCVLSAALALSGLWACRNAGRLADAAVNAAAGAYLSLTRPDAPAGPITIHVRFVEDQAAEEELPCARTVRVTTCPPQAPAGEIPSPGSLGVGLPPEVSPPPSSPSPSSSPPSGASPASSSPGVYPLLPRSLHRPHPLPRPVPGTPPAGPVLPYSPWPTTSAAPAGSPP